MQNRTVMRQALADTIEAEGEDSLLEAICSRVAEGENPVVVAKSMGFSWFVVREWLEEGGRMKRLDLAKRCFADGLMWSSLEAARDAEPESVNVARLQVDAYQKAAGKMSRVDWGQEATPVGGFGAGGVTIVIGEVKSPYLTAEPVGEVIEQKVEDVKSVIL